MIVFDPAAVFTELEAATLKLGAEVQQMWPQLFYLLWYGGKGFEHRIFAPS